MAKKTAGKTMTTRKQYIDDSAKSPSSMGGGTSATVEKRQSGREIWHVEGKTYITSSSSTAAMDQSVKKFRKTLKRLAKQ